MAKQEKKEGKIEFNEYELKWNDEGMTILATDYHAGALTLSWELIFDLAKRAGMKTPKK